MSGVKHDQGKPRCSLLPSIALLKIAEILTFGEKKYKTHNWRKGMAWSRILDATYRHLLKYNNNIATRKDKETRISHLAHAATNLLFLIEYEEYNIGEDDLWKGHGNHELPRRSPQNGKRKTKPT